MKQNKRGWAGTGLLALLPLTAAYAAEELAPVVVVGDSLSELTETRMAGGDVQASPAADAGEALRGIPGVSGVRMGGHGVDPVIRGQSQTRLNILLDGAYIHGGCPNRMDPPTSYAPIETFDEVTVIKGNHSVIHGAGGSGGTVLLNRTTRPLEEGERLRGKAALGGRSNSKASDAFLDLTTGAGPLSLRGVVSHKDARNYKDGKGVQVRSAYSEKAASLMLGLRPSAATEIQFSADASRSEDVLFAGAGMDSPRADDNTYRMRLSQELDGDSLRRVKAEFYQSDVIHSMDNYSLRVATGPFRRAPSTSVTTGGRVSLDLEGAGATQWTVGMDLQRNDREADRFNDTLGLREAIMWPGVRLDQTGLFAEMNKPMGEADSLKAGLRYDRVEADAAGAGQTPVVAGWLGPNQVYTLYYGTAARRQTENNVGGFLRYEHALDALPGLAYAGLSRSVRTADATERFMAVGAPGPMAAMRWVGNPNIDPEKHHQAEVGVELDWQRLSVNGSIYYTDVSDYILRDRAHAQDGILLADNATIYRNVDARLAGTEVAADYRLNDRWTLGASLAYVYAENTSDDRVIAQTPPLEASLNADYDGGRWSVGGSLRAVARQHRVDTSVLTGSGLDSRETPGFGVLEVHGEMAVNRQLQLRFGVDNLLDREYAEHLNKSNAFDVTQVQVNEPGRSLWARLSLDF